MNRAVPDHIIEEIRSRCNIVDVIRDFIPLQKAGSGSWKALCPFHREKTPSFTISEQRQYYHCFGCGKGGDVFRFIMEWENVDFPNAIHLLAAKCGVIIPERTESMNPQERKLATNRANRRERLYAINEEFAKWYALLLEKHPDSAVTNYLRSREIPDDIVKQFQLGASPDAWDDSLKHGKAAGFSEDELLDAGLILRNEESKHVYDRFRNRLMFPIWNAQGRVVGFSARTIEAEAQGAKYVNSPETQIFKKSNVLYALPLARRHIHEHKMAILCEGQLDVIAMHRADFGCAVAPQGTAFTDEQARLLKRYTDRILLAFDSDSAGIKAALRTLELLLPLDFEVSIINFPEGQDPDGIFRAQGADKLKQIVNQPNDLLDFLCKAIFARHNPATPYGKSRIVAEIVQYLKKISKPVAREAYVQKLSTKLGVSQQAVYKELNSGIAAEKLKFKKNSPPSTPVPVESVNPNTDNLPPLPRAVAHAEYTLLELIINFERIGNQLAHELPSEILSNTAVGKALNEILSSCLNGEREHLIDNLVKLQRETPDPALSQLLAKETSFNESQLKKAVDECVSEIKRNQRYQHETKLLAKLRQAETPEEKQQLLKQLQKNNIKD